MKKGQREEVSEMVAKIEEYKDAPEIALEICKWYKEQGWVSKRQYWLLRATCSFKGDLI